MLVKPAFPHYQNSYLSNKLLEILLTNNDTLRSLRYTLNYNDAKMISMFTHVDHKVTRKEISYWLKKDEDPEYKDCGDVELATFLNGLICEKRGKKDGPQPEPESRLSNNIVFRKLKIAFNLKNEDVVDIMALANFEMSNHELTAFFRRPDHKNYRPCKNQMLRNFLKGLQVKYRPSESDS